MREATLERYETGDDGTAALFSVHDSGFQCYFGEPPWRDDKTDISCIADGDYMMDYRYSEKHGRNLYHIEDAKRPGAEWHRGNWFGDVSKGFKSDSKGCQIPGRAIGELAGQKAVLSSKDALEAVENEMGREKFLLHVRWRKGVGPGA